MKFRVRMFVLASAACIACMLFVFLDPKFAWISGYDDADNDYVDVGNDGLDSLDQETQRFMDIQNGHVAKKSLFPFTFEADIFNASAREAMIERFLAWYDIRWDFQPAPGTDLWEVAAGWVTPEEIHGEYVPELGQLCHFLKMHCILFLLLNIFHLLLKSFLHYLFLLCTLDLFGSQ